MNALFRLGLSAAAGAAAMYWLDPQHGRRRRAIARDQIASRYASVCSGAQAGARDLKNRAQGIGAALRTRMTREEAEDTVLTARVRACMGRVVSHTGAIDVLVHDGEVTLVGAVLAREHDSLLKCVRTTRGVRHVHDHLSVHERAGKIPELQGDGSLSQTTNLFARERWTAGTRLLMGVGGGALSLIGAQQLVGPRKSGLLGLALLLGGGAALARTWTNVPLTQLAGASGRRAIDIRKTILVHAPVEQVFATLSQYENFPRFMRNVLNVSTRSDGHSHWEVAGPAGASVQWESETTACKPNELLAWRTVPGSTVAHAGIIRFEPHGDATRLYIQMSYNPPAGAIGHVFARLFGADPKTELHEDMLRLKSFLESGKAPRDAAAKMRDAAAATVAAATQ